MTEDAWVEVARNLKRRPPMSWFNPNAMRERSLRALYQFIHSPDDPGQPAPSYATFPPPPPANRAVASALTIGEPATGNRYLPGRRPVS